MQTVVLATTNSGKIQEIKHYLADFHFSFLTQDKLGVGPISETGLTFVENALIKARHAAQQTGLPAIADDSGLCVESLQGAPGIYSARFSGHESRDDEKRQKLLQDMQDMPLAARLAHFYCVIVYMRHAHDPAPLICQGQWKGSIAYDEKGEGGFGYDAIFNVAQYSCTAAQLSLAQKNALSHRAQALAELVKKLQDAEITPP